jgi:long-subunit acyl-CoA synthetase (AMP-forming)
MKAVLELPRRSCVGICLENGPEWLISDFACM